MFDLISLNSNMKIFQWILSVVVAIILLQTLYFKFTGQPESIFIFSTIGMEPWGRIGSGVVELFAGVFVLIPRWRVWGALIGLTTMTGALFFHLTKLGIEIQGDGGQLFAYAIIVWLSCGILIFLNREKLKPA